MPVWLLLVTGLLAAGSPHLRPDGAELQALVAETAARSPTFRHLVDRLERSDLIVYVRAQHFPTTRIDGRIGFVTGSNGATGMRILLVELACPRTAAAQAETLAHELHHATEIADAPWVRDTASLAAYYQRIGEMSQPLSRGLAFETPAAQAVATRVRQELWSALKLAVEDR